MRTPEEETPYAKAILRAHKVAARLGSIGALVWAVLVGLPCSHSEERRKDESETLVHQVFSYEGEPYRCVAYGMMPYAYDLFIWANAALL